MWKVFEKSFVEKTKNCSNTIVKQAALHNSDFYETLFK